MKKIALLFIITTLSINVFAQGRIKIAYVDMEYILSKLPEHQTALKELENKAARWKSEIEKRTKEITDLKQVLEQEKVLLTKELLQEKEEEIAFKEKELLKYQLAKFGPEGDYVLQKQRLVSPVQDRVFGAVSKLIKTAKYDIVFDKSNDNLGLIYTSTKLDISDKILKMISKDRKKEDRKKDAKKRKEKKQRELTEAQKARKEMMAKKKKEREEKRKKALEERKRKREASKKKEANKDDKKKTEEEKKETADKPAKEEKKESKENEEKFGKKLTPEQLKKFESQVKLTPEQKAAKRKAEREARRKKIIEERKAKKAAKQENK
jgi:Skp family chaperone for outer membrane proteins